MGILENIFGRKTEKAKNERRIAFINGESWAEYISGGRYISMADCPEVLTGVRKIADLISSMTIYLMANSQKGDIRVQNELSRKVDINPMSTMTRRTWVTAIVMNLLLYGRGNSVVRVHMRNERLPNGDTRYLIDDMEPIRRDRVSFKEIDDGRDYRICIDGVDYDPNDNLLHFVFNPDPRHMWKGDGITASLHDVRDNLKQASRTTKRFMRSKWKPSMIVKVDALIDEFSSPEGRQKLLNDYVKAADVGSPWLIPADQFEVEQIRPLSLQDLRIDKTIELDRRTVASILGVPAFVLGVGDFNRDEWNAFINNTIRPIRQEIEQELTKKLLISEKMYFRFNLFSLYSYDLNTLANVFGNLYKSGLVLGNEVRDKLGMTPLDNLDKLVILENYIPIDKIGDQSKIN